MVVTLPISFSLGLKVFPSPPPPPPPSSPFSFPFLFPSLLERIRNLLLLLLLSPVSTQGILVILAGCLGGVLLCLVIGIGCYRYCRSRRYRATRGDEILVIPLREEDVATEL